MEEVQAAETAFAAILGDGPLASPMLELSAFLGFLNFVGVMQVNLFFLPWFLEK